MRQKALELGLISTTKEALTPQQKVLAAQALIYQQTSAAQGDFARTSGGLANQQRILEAQMTNLKATVGTALLPVWLSFTAAANDLAQTVLPPLVDFVQSSLVPVFQVIGITIQALYDVLMGNEPIGDWANLWESIADIMGPGLADVIYNILTAIDDLRLAIIPAVETATQWFSRFRTSVTEDATGPLAYFKSWVDDNLPRIQTLIANVLSAIQSFWAEHGDAIMHVVENYLHYIFTVFDTVFKTILDLVTLTLQILTGDWEGAGETLKGIVQRLWDAIYEIIRLAIDSIKAIFNDFNWYSIGSNMMGGIRDGINSGSSWIYDSVLSTVQNAYNSATNWLGIHSPSERAKQGIGRPFVQGIAQGIQNEMGTLSLNVNAGLAGMMDSISLPQMAAATSSGHSISISIANTFNGPADADMVETGTRDGVRAALRAAGLM